MCSAFMVQEYLKGLNGYSCFVLLFYHFNELCDDLICHIVDVPSTLRSGGQTNIKSHHQK